MPLSGLTGSKPSLNAAFLTLWVLARQSILPVEGSGEPSAEEQGPWSWSGEPQGAVGPWRKHRLPGPQFPLL